MDGVSLVFTLAPLRGSLQTGRQTIAGALFAPLAAQASEERADTNVSRPRRPGEAGTAEREKSS